MPYFDNESKPFDNESKPFDKSKPYFVMSEKHNIRKFTMDNPTSSISSDDLVKLYGSEEKALVYTYHWDKSGKITMNQNGNYSQNSI